MKVRPKSNRTLGITKVDLIQGKSKDNISLYSLKTSKPEIIELNKNTNPIWIKAREKLKKLLGEGVDKSFLSKIDFEYNDESGKVRLLFQSKFIKEYVDNNYGSHINRVLPQEINDLQEIIYKVNSSINEDIVWRKAGLISPKNIIAETSLLESANHFPSMINITLEQSLRL